MLQSTSQMAKVQELFAIERSELKFIPPHGPYFGWLWDAAVKSMKYHLRRTFGSQVAIFEELCTLLVEVEACLYYGPLCAISDDPFNPTYLSTGHFLIGEPLTHLPAATLLMSNAIDFPGGKRTNNNCNSSGNVVLLTTSRVCNSVNDGSGHPLTYNQVISSCWGRTTRHLCPGRQLLSQTYIQGRMASSEWSQLEPPREYLNVPLQKCALYRLWIVNYSVIVWGWQYVTISAEFL